MLEDMMICDEADVTQQLRVMIAARKTLLMFGRPGKDKKILKEEARRGRTQEEE